MNSAEKSLTPEEKAEAQRLKRIRDDCDLMYMAQMNKRAKQSRLEREGQQQR